MAIVHSSALFACLLACISLALPAAGAEWKQLFNGKDLSGWKAIDGPINSWHVEDGMLYCSGQGSGWLSTDGEYGDFEVELEFRVPAAGNSGVFLRAPHQGNPAYAGMEIQILDDGDTSYKDLKPTQYTGSVYDVVAATPRVTKKPGEWQKMSILCKGDKVKVTVNGTQVVDADLSAHPDKVETHPGLKRTKGYLGLQNHGSRLDFRNLRIREL